MRVVFMGTPEFSVPVLDALIEAGHDVACVYTQPPRPGGRGKKTRMSPVHVRAESLGLLVRHPARLRDEAALADFRGLQSDIAVVVAYGLLLPEAILQAPMHGCVNIHASLLPRWRGAAPIQRAIMAGDAETGICIMQMEAGLDTGPVYLRDSLQIGATETAGELAQRLSRLGAQQILNALDQLPGLEAVAQDTDGVKYADKINKSEARVDWAESAARVDGLIRGLAPSPGAWCDIAGERVKLLRSRVCEGSGALGAILPGFRVVCGYGRAVEILELQRPGKRVVSAAEFARGVALPTQMG
ncbi:MAG: methionyl-tRNA formyltransferase [Pseudomonadota bacterium]